MTSPSDETGMTMVSGLSCDRPKEGRESRRRDSVSSEERRDFTWIVDLVSYTNWNELSLVYLIYISTPTDIL